MLARARRTALRDPLGLYLHIPFCSAICHYCNFNRGLFDEGLKLAYVDALAAEIRRGATGEFADTIYFGGGTPSLLDPPEVARLIAACRDGFDVARAAEITLELNPETVTPERLEGFGAAGVNRLSMGVQSFVPAELARLGRQHTVERAIEAVETARRTGFDNLSLDLMMWLPDQTLDDWRRSLAALIGLAPAHASLYLLEIYPNAPLRDEMARGGWTLAADDVAAEMYVEAMDALGAAGLHQYEISNVARDGRESRHNLKYWSDGEWLGFGCGAHSTRDGARWKNVADVREYIRRLGERADVAVERRQLSPATAAEEAVFMGLRLVGGVDLSVVGRRYGIDLVARHGEALRPHLEAGLAILDGSRLRLSGPGRLLANEVMTVFV